ncbi:hypothetical protein HNQ50_001503 [Silvimonas terrae]|uniref:Uncharacterized protein n=1 Tax=Silvimonas terrae TaxID=300266 RepID=A0A840REH4_9NEIS|nr:hypothetical protein [Silvimonas terrae]
MPTTSSFPRRRESSCNIYKHENAAPVYSIVIPALGGPLGPESSPQPNGLLAVDCRFAPNPPYGFGIATICGTVAGIAALFLGGLSEGGFIAPASKGHLR